MELVRLGIIGCGAISKKHGEAISRIEDAKLVARQTWLKKTATICG